MPDWLLILLAAGGLTALPGLVHLLRSRRPRGELDFNIVDEAIHHLDTEAEPWTVHVEARVAGSLDEARVRAAVRAAMARHPMARAFQRRWTPWQTVYRWGLSDTVARDPLEVESAATDEALAEARARFESTRVPIDAPPPFRVLLARHPGGDHLMLNLNHAARDGVGTLRFFRSIARAYAGEAEPRLLSDSLSVRDLSRGTAPRSLRERVARLGALSELLRDAVLEPPARLAGDGGGPGERSGSSSARSAPRSRRASRAASWPAGPSTTRSSPCSTGPSSAGTRRTRSGANASER